MQNAETVLGVLRERGNDVHGVGNWRATCIERCPRGSEGGRAEKGLDIRHLAARPTLWKAAWCFHDEGDRAVEAWVANKARAVLAGKATRVAGAIRRQATTAALSANRRVGADVCATYLTNKAPYLDYPTALASGWPIATGVIEGACRHIVADRLDITGARWGLAGAEAILKLRALRSNGATSTNTSGSTSRKNDAETTRLATPTRRFRPLHDVPPEEPHP
jgi:hypothetical protein